MPVISFCNPKGGSGKTTCAVLLATYYARQNTSTTIIDADPEQWALDWYQRSTDLGPLDVVAVTNEDDLIDQIEAASQRSDIVIVDLEGTANILVPNAINMSDLVLIPVQGSSMDAKGASKVIRTIRTQQKITQRDVSYSIIFTRANAAVESREMREVRMQLKSANVPTLMISIIERAAYRSILSFGGNLHGLDKKRVSGIPNALINAEEYGNEVSSLLAKSAQSMEVLV